MISIIVPIYNSELHLRRTIDSILAQSYKELEVILVNDGSTDKSPFICDQYAIFDKRIKVIHQPNQGVSVARNVGIESASGEYIQFIDADDFVDVNMVQEMVLNIEKYKCDLVICGYKNVNNNGEVLSAKSPTNIIEGLLTKGELLGKFGRLYENLFLNSMCNKIYSKQLIDNYKIRLIKGLDRGEDLLFNLSYLNHCRTIFVSDYDGYNYVQYGLNSHSATSRFQNNIENNQVFLYNETKKFLLMNNAYQEENFEIIETNHIKNIMECLWYYFNFKNSLTNKELMMKISTIFCVINDNDYYSSFTPKGIQETMLFLLVKNKNIKLTLLLLILKRNIKRIFNKVI